jgi:hypothetical protein
MAVAAGLGLEIDAGFAVGERALGLPGVCHDGEPQNVL